MFFPKIMLRKIGMFMLFPDMSSQTPLHESDLLFHTLPFLSFPDNVLPLLSASREVDRKFSDSASLVDVVVVNIGLNPEERVVTKKVEMELSMGSRLWSLQKKIFDVFFRDSDSESGRPKDSDSEIYQKTSSQVFLSLLLEDGRRVSLRGLNGLTLWELNLERCRRSGEAYLPTKALRIEANLFPPLEEADIELLWAIVRWDNEEVVRQVEDALEKGADAAILARTSILSTSFRGEGMLDAQIGREDALNFCISW